MTGTEVVVVPPESVELGMVRGSSPGALVAAATAAADVLANVINNRKLFSNISGKKYVRCEGWTTLAALMGFVPREASMLRREDGSYEAVAELVRITDGVALTRASAECGMSEPTWAKRADYARRSMAATRATSKVCRLAFSWVMGLAGFEVTPFEEIPEEERHKPKEPQPLSEKPAALQAKEPMPWDAHVWPAPGPKKGMPIAALTSEELITGLAWLRKTGRYGELVEPMEELLESRAGE